MSPEPNARLHTSGLTLRSYAEAKRLPLDFLQSLGLKDVRWRGVHAVHMPYMCEVGVVRAVRYRVGLEDDDRFRWASRTKVMPYGLWRLQKAREQGYLILCEGESDTQTLLLHGLPALGLPGATSWKAEWASYFDGIGTIYVVREPDQGGEAVEKWLPTSPFRDRVRLLTMPEVDGRVMKDPSDLHCADAGLFSERLRAAMEQATPWAEFDRAERLAAQEAAWARCRELATEPNILDLLGDALQREGYCGDLRPAKTIYLAVTSRLLDRPVSVALKGPSSAGKSFTAKQTLSFFPNSAFYALTAMSDKALAHGDEPLTHRTLVIYEAAGLSGDVGTYLLRSLLSEGHIRYEFAETTTHGIRNRRVEREGPTGLLITTTALELHPENETRLFSVTVSDSREVTASIVGAIFADERQQTDHAPWVALQEWLQHQDNRVSVPFGRVLAGLIPPVAVRMRRDASAILGLIKAHASLHQETRARDSQGQIVATLDDYEAVRDLVANIVAEGVEASVPANVRETVQAVAKVLAEKPVAGVPPHHEPAANVSEVAKVLGLDPSSPSRRVKQALRSRFLQNREERRGATARLVLGDPMPESIEILPSRERLAQACKRAEETGGVEGDVDDEWGEVRVEA